MHIGEDLEKILQNHGYQCEDPSAEKYINIGVNWGYAGAQLSANMDLEMVACVIVMLVLVVLLQLTDTFAGSFDMDKYLRPWVVSDFILGDACL